MMWNLSDIWNGHELEGWESMDDRVQVDTPSHASHMRNSLVESKTTTTTIYLLP
jgi:hypothetical protein